MSLVSSLVIWVLLARVGFVCVGRRVASRNQREVGVNYWEWAALESRERGQGALVLGRGRGADAGGG